MLGTIEKVAWQRRGCCLTALQAWKLGQRHLNPSRIGLQHVQVDLEASWTLVVLEKQTGRSVLLVGRAWELAQVLGQLNLPLAEAPDRR